MYNVISGKQDAPLSSTAPTGQKTAFFVARPHWVRRGALATAFAAVVTAAAPFVLKNRAEDKIIALTGASILAAYARKLQSTARDFTRRNSPSNPTI